MKLIDSEKLKDWLQRQMDSSDNMYAANAYDRVRDELVSGTFDPTPPVQPDIKPGDKVRHKSGGSGYGIGTVQRLSRSGERAFVVPWGSYYRLDKLEVIKDE